MFLYICTIITKQLSFFTKDKSIKVNDVLTQNIFENFEGGKVIKIKFTNRDNN